MLSTLWYKVKWMRLSPTVGKRKLCGRSDWNCFSQKDGKFLWADKQVPTIEKFESVIRSIQAEEKSVEDVGRFNYKIGVSQVSSVDLKASVQRI